MSRCTVLHITQSLGGVRTYLENIFEHSDPQNFKFIIAAPPHTNFQLFCKQRDITYHPINIKRSINPFRDLWTLFSLISIIIKQKPNVVHCHSAKGGFLGRIAAKMCRVNVIYTPHAFSYLSFTGIKRVIFYFLEYIAKRWTDLLLAVSYSEANRAHFDLGFRKNKVHVFLNSIPITNVTPVVTDSSNINIGMIGRLTYQKNPLLFLEIACRLLKKYPTLHFSILGAGMQDDLSEEIEDFIQKNKITDHITIHPWGEQSVTKTFLSNTDIFVMTSVFEGLPYSLLEAMERGVPSVVSIVDGNSDVIQNGENGFACISVECFCSKIEILILNPELRKEIGSAGLEYVKSKHDIKLNIKQIESIYYQLTKSKVIKCHSNYSYLYK